MKPLIYSLACVSILLFGCNVTTTVTPLVVTALPVGTVVPVDTAAPVVGTATPIPATETPPGPQANVICNELTLILDPALASGFNCQTIPEVSGADVPAWGVNPQYTEVILTGYVLVDRFFEAHIDVFPVQRFSELFPETIDQRVASLQLLIAGGAPVETTLPLLPVFNAAQEFYAQYQVLPLMNGSGIRYLTQYSQFADPVNNHEMFYSFQGLTSDGKYWISAILPASNSILLPNGDNPPDGQTWSDFEMNFTTYLGQTTNQLNSLAADSFNPSLAALDELVSSITIQP